MSKMSSIFEKINEEIKRNIQLLHVFRDYNEKNNVILVTDEDKVHCFGGNICGVLGFSHQNNINEFTINDELSNKRIIDFKSSRCHTIGRDCDGKLYCWGMNALLGNGRESYCVSLRNQRLKPELNKFLINEKIIDMCCGYEHTLVLTSNNEVYAWGDNYWGQIGNRSSGKIVLIPYKHREFNAEKVKAISCGSCYSMALTKSGRVYSWGCNNWGQLGLNNGYKDENNPKRIQIEIEIKKISCGNEHSLLLSHEGDIYVFGSNEYKQLGFETNEGKQLTPIKLNHSEKFIDIASHHSINK